MTEPCLMPVKFVHRSRKLALAGTKIGEMEIGESAWITPWSIFVLRDRQCYVHLDQTVEESPGGTVDTLIFKSEEGFIADISNTDHVWRPNYGLPTSGRFAPIIRLVTTEHEKWFCA